MSNVVIVEKDIGQQCVRNLVRKTSQVFKASPSCFILESTSLSVPVCSNKEKILMKTIRVRVIRKNGSFSDVRLLFDEGSQKSYISTKLAKKMRCPVNKIVQQQNSLFGSQTS